MAWVWPEDLGAKYRPKSAIKSSWPTPEEQIKSTAMSENNDRKVGSFKINEHFTQRELFSN